MSGSEEEFVMELTLLHLYPDAMSLYGEYANLSVLRRVLELMGVEVTVRSVGLDDTPDFSDAGLIYMGAGTERSQKWALEALRPHVQPLKEAVERGVPLLFTGNAMELLGSAITDQSGRVWPGLALAAFETREGERRTVEDVVAHTPLWQAPVVGFMNKCSATQGVTTPLFAQLSLGTGNCPGEQGEGYVEGNVIATHLAGPVLVKNPAFLNWLVGRMAAFQAWTLPEPLPQLPYQHQAYDVTVKELTARAGGHHGERSSV